MDQVRPVFANLNEAKLFFKRFAEKDQQLVQYKIDRDRTALSGFLRNFGNYERLAFQFREQSATYYNVFQVLGLGRYEEKLHTPFLADLLNPKGEHSQGRLFFDAFFSEALGMGDLLTGISHIEILPEHHTPYGRIDILVKYRVGGKLRAVVIENKIYASDQPRQLERYHNYLDKTLGLLSGEYFMVYLTPWKTDPSIEKEGEECKGCSITQATYDKLCHEKSFIKTGYHEDIGPLLKRCLAHIKAAIVSETVKQYLKTIQTL